MRIRFFRTPYGRLCLTLFVSILIGWLLLMLPCMAAREPLTWLDSLFTSTSAICVTGLTVRSTGNDFSPLGQVVILILIQIGGLGFMTLSSSVLMHLRQKITLEQFAVIRESLGQHERERLPQLMLRCLRIVVIAETIGAVLLFVRFSWAVPAGSSWLRHAPMALWQAVFHSVSAFCNAGFSVWDDSLTRYTYDVWVNLVMGGLIVLGGLGFFVLADVESWLRSSRGREPHRFTFQSRLVLVTTATLVVGGAVLIWLGEWMNPGTMAGVPLCRRWMVPLFQSITARTAGFSTVDVRELSNFSTLVTILLMFIGASPGSCGGGVKTTTFAVFAILAIGSFASDREPNFRHRSLGPVTIRSAITLVFVAAALVLCGALFLTLVELGGLPLRETQAAFVQLLFEAVSAFGTVGLSTGVTPFLTVPAKLCLILLMFLGRVGPLGLVSVSLRSGVRPAIRYPQEDVQIG